MALYYNIPNDLEKLKQDTMRAASNHNTQEWKEAIVVKMYGSLKIVIDGIIGRDYSGCSDAYFEGILFDPKTPEIWETQVNGLINKYWTGKGD